MDAQLVVGDWYRVVDGTHDGAEGVLMGVDEQAFGRVYVELVTDEGKSVVRCRAVDVRPL